MAFKGAIEVDSQKCKGCGVCVENCPTKSIELSKLVKEIKNDVGQISTKHKDHLTETLKRSKENTIEVWNKVSNK